ncbi:MAG TPA: transcriptional regulator [Aeromonadales bacterium]|nr:transcriptional regulator [Aeromonadales bacterium]
MDIPRILKFNDSVLDTANFTLVINGQPKAVEPRVFDLIVYLIKHRHKVITRQQLFDDLWEGRSVSDATLSNHIKMARAVLGDDGEQQSVIKTIRSRGYQFIAHVEEDPGSKDRRRVTKEKKPDHGVSFTHQESQYQISKKLAGVLIGLVVLSFIYWLSSHSSDSNLETSKELANRPYILVVPFGLSVDDTEKWAPFADQITREVIRKLRKISGLRVIPASSAFTFKQNKNATFIRQQLPNVRYILDAVVNISSKGNIRIIPQLEDIQTGKLVWDYDYRSRIDDSNFFKIQSDIAESVSKALKIVIQEEERSALGKLPTSNLVAYELFVKGKQQFDILTQESLYRAIDLFSEAIALDTKFEAAYIAKADSYRMLMSYYEKPVDTLPLVIDAVVEALKINPDSSEARSSLGLAYVFAWRWEDAWNMLNEARERNPDLALTELGFALYYSGIGDIEGIYRSLERASQLDPLNVEIADWGHWSLAMAGEIEAAVNWSKKQLRLHPKVGVIYSGASISAALSGNNDRAIRLGKQGVVLDRGSSFSLLALAQVYGYAGKLEQLRPLLKKARLYPGYVCPYETAIVYVILDEKDTAFKLLNKAIDYRSNCLVFIRNDPRLSPLKNDPRFVSLLTRVGVDDEAVGIYSH